MSDIVFGIIADEKVVFKSRLFRKLQQQLNLYPHSYLIFCVIDDRSIKQGEEYDIIYSSASYNKFKEYVKLKGLQ